MTPQTRKLVSITLLVAIVAAVLTGGAVWLGRQRTIDRLRDELDAQRERAEQFSDELETLEGSAETTSPGTGGSLAGSEEPSAAGQASSAGAAGASEGAQTAQPAESKQFTFLTQVQPSAGAVQVVADYAQFLTGEAAAKAAAERGDESPPPNDYYIVNDNPKLRTLSVDPNASVRLTTTSEGTTVGPRGYSVSLAEFVTLFTASPAIRSVPYYLTLSNGQVTAIAEVYLP